MRLPEPGTFEHLLKPVSVRVSRLVRLSKGPSTEPYWSSGKRHRFDDPGLDLASRFGVLYAGDRLETAFAESVIHEVALHMSGAYLVPRTDLDARHVVTFEHVERQTLRLADLTGTALKALGLNNDLSSSDDYGMSQAWSSAIYSAKPRWDGIRYVSRQRNDARAYAIFNRSGLNIGRSRPMSGDERSRLCRAEA